MPDDRRDCERMGGLLEDYVLGRLDPEEAADVERHLAECADCRSDLAFIRALGQEVYRLERGGAGHHPSAEALVELASWLERGSEQSELGDGMGPARKQRALEHLEHLKCCGFCRDTFETLQAASADLTAAPHHPGEQALIERICARRRRPWSLGGRLEAIKASVKASLARPVIVGGLAAVSIAVIVAGFYLSRSLLPGPRSGEHRAAQAPAWQPIMEQANALAAAGEADSADALADRAIAAGLTQYVKSKAKVPIRLYHDGIGHTYYFPDIGSAEKLYGEARSVKERAMGAPSPQVAAILMDLGSIYLAHQRPLDARDSFARALAIRRRAIAADDPKIGQSVGALAGALLSAGDLEQAEALYRQGLAALERSEGPEHPDVAVALTGLGWSLSNQWRHAESVPFYERALAIRRKTLGQGDPDLVDSLNRLANLYKQLARYSEAKELFAEALAIREKTLEYDDPDLAMSYDNLANICMAQGKYADAAPLYLDAREVRVAGLGENHPDVGASYHYLGNVTMALGLYDKAESYYRQGLRLREKLGRDHPDVATSLTDVAMVDEVVGDRKEAERLLKRALAIREKTLGESHPGVPNPGVAMSLEDLANLYTLEHKYDLAEPLYQRAISVWENSMGPDHPNVASALEAASRLYRLRGKVDLALQTAQRAAAVRCGNLAQNAESMTEEDALGYSKFMRRSVGNYLSCFLEAKPTDQARIADAADLIFRTKGEISDEIFGRQRRTLESSDPAIQRVATSLRAAQDRLAERVFARPIEEDPTYEAGLDSVRHQVADLETELAQHSADFSWRQDYNGIGASRLASALPKGATLIEYVRFDYVLAGPDSIVPHYLAVVLKAEGGPAIADLGEASHIDALVKAYRDHMLAVPERIGVTAVAAAEYRKIGGSLYSAVWKPVEKYVGTPGEDDLVMIAPDGALSAISFATLADAEGKYLIERFPVHYLASGRDLIRLEDQTKPGTGLLALGDPDYSAPVAMRLEEIAPREKSELQLAALTRNVRSACAGMQGLGPAGSLPGTRAEVENVASTWARLSDQPAVVCLGPAASEERFKMEAPGKRVIHLATHGFFLDEACDPQWRMAAPSQWWSGIQAMVEHPLLLSGVLLAGANLRGLDSDTPGADDGILTAYEISAMNLRGTDLVVLSACETGLGEVMTGEGVYGLRRSFQMAGARTVVSALWDIPDAAGVTAGIVSGLYGRGHQSLAQALRVMQLARIRTLRSQGGIDHPYSWGAFVATGDWR